MVERVIDLGEQVEDPRQHLGRNADPVVANPEHHLGPLGRGRQADLPAGLSVLGRIVQQVGEDLGHPDRVGIDIDRLRRQGDRQAMMMRLDDRTAGFDRVGHDGCDVDGLFLEPDLAAGDPGNLQQFVDQLGQLAHLVVDDIAGPAQVGIVRTALLHDLDGVADRGQRVAQLVAQHRQKLVLADIGLGQLPCLGLARSQRGFRPASLHDLAPMTLDVARIRHRRQQPHQGQRGRPACDRRQHRHRRRARGWRHHQSTCQLRKAAEDEQNTQRPDTAHEGYSATRSRPGVKRTITMQSDAQPSASRPSEVRCTVMKPGPSACQSRMDHELSWSRKRIRTSKSVTFLATAQTATLESSCRRPCRDAIQMY